MVMTNTPQSHSLMTCTALVSVKMIMNGAMQVIISQSLSYKVMGLTGSLHHYHDHDADISSIKRNKIKTKYISKINEMKISTAKVHQNQFM